MVVDTKCAKVIGIVVPNCESKFRLFKSNDDLFIPWNNIIKIGKDVILVDISHISTQNLKETGEKVESLSQENKNIAK